MKLRDDLKRMYRQVMELRKNIQIASGAYEKELDGRRGIYITDHAIRRYLERVKGFELNDELTDEEYIRQLVVPPEVIRDEMLTIEEDRKILRGQRSLFHRGEHIYIIKELAIVTVLHKIKN